MAPCLSHVHPATQRPLQLQGSLLQCPEVRLQYLPGHALLSGVSGPGRLSVSLYIALPSGARLCGPGFTKLRFLVFLGVQPYFRSQVLGGGLPRLPGARWVLLYGCNIPQLSEDVNWSIFRGRLTDFAVSSGLGFFRTFVSIFHAAGGPRVPGGPRLSIHMITITRTPASASSGVAEPPCCWVMTLTPGFRGMKTSFPVA